MHLLLDGRGPLHAQLTRALKTAMVAGRVSRGSRLPPTRMLARELGLSRNTVLTAYEQLRAEGFVDGRIGSGSYAALPLLAMAANDPQPLTSQPQSNFSRRGRAVHDHARMPGRREDGVRYAFQYGLPLVNPALASTWARELAHAAAYTSPNYPYTQGLPALREAICDYLARRRGVQATPDDVLVVSGTQQAMALTARVLLNEGDRVAIEEPQYFAIRELLQIHGARLAGVSVDDEGLCCDALPSRSPQLIYVTPSHQFPSGSVLSLSRRMELLQYARRNQSWIFEDDYDGEFRYDSQPLAALRSLDHDGRVIYVGTFSKTLFPALRLGYMVMPAALRQDFITAKWTHDFGTPAIEQAALANLMANGGFERHLRRSSKILRERRAALLDGLRALDAGRLEISDSRAGMHLVAWLRGKNAAEGDAMIAHGLRLGLGLQSIRPHYLEPPDRAGLLMGYAGMSVTEIQEALVLFGRCLNAAYA